jgi:hypothetical protein
MCLHHFLLQLRASQRASQAGVFDIIFSNKGECLEMSPQNQIEEIV